MTEMKYPIVLVVAIGLAVVGLSLEDNVDADSPTRIEVHKKENGDLKINTSKDRATIVANPRSVSVTFDSSQDVLQQPIVPSKVSQPLNIVEDAFQGLKRSQVENETMNTMNLEDEYNEAMLQGQRAFQQSMKLSRWNHAHKIGSRRNASSTVDMVGSKSPGAIKSRKMHERGQSREKENESKRSQVDGGMTVHGQSGSLRVHAALKEVNLTSQSGNLFVFMENPGHRHEVESDVGPATSGLTVSQFVSGDAKKRAMQDEISEGKVHVVNDVTGLKKSKVAKSAKRKFFISRQAFGMKDSHKRSKHGPIRLCLNGKLPPCTLGV